MSHDAGNLQQKISGSKIFWLITIALVLILGPYLWSRLPKWETGNKISHQSQKIYVGLEAEEDWIRYSLSQEWGPIIQVRLRNRFEIVPPEGGYIEYLPEGSRSSLKFYYGETPYLPGFIFRLRGSEGLATIMTTPLL